MSSLNLFRLESQVDSTSTVATQGRSTNPECGLLHESNRPKPKEGVEAWYTERAEKAWAEARAEWRKV